MSDKSRLFQGEASAAAARSKSGALGGREAARAEAGRNVETSMAWGRRRLSYGDRQDDGTRTALRSRRHEQAQAPQQRRWDPAARATAAGDAGVGRRNRPGRVAGVLRRIGGQRRDRAPRPAPDGQREHPLARGSTCAT